MLPGQKDDYTALRRLELSSVIEGEGRRTHSSHMARLSKTYNFKIHEDTGITTPPIDDNDPFKAVVALNASQDASGNRVAEYTEDQPANSTRDILPDVEDDAFSRVSITSVSTFPESTSQQHDFDQAHPPISPQKFFTHHTIHPSFRRPESIRRMQMSSPRQSILSYCRSSRSGTPSSGPAGGSPRTRRRITEKSPSEEEVAGDEDKREHPLVLLHITLLPITLPWSTQSMRELLPPQVVIDLQSLKSKVSENVLQRGVLIPHPREEYEMLEERLLEALELKEERLTKCGHFLGRLSDSSRDSASVDSDSGLGSSSDSAEDDERCATCRHHVHCSAGKKQKWSVKVFAANGLMRSAAWTAAWSQMENVDVEILPWISEDDRRRLDQRKEEENMQEALRRKVQDARISEATGTEMNMPQEDKPREDFPSRDVEGPDCHDREVVLFTSEPARQDQHTSKPALVATTSTELPQIYPRSQIPLSILLKNYIFLLAKDRQNVGIFFVGLLALFFATQRVSSRATTTLAPVGAALNQQVFESYNGGLASERMPIVEYPDDGTASLLEDEVGAEGTVA